MPVIEANGIQQRYEITGEGTTVFWIHGIGSSHHAWDSILPNYDGFRHVVYDVRGMGDSERSDRTSGPMSLELWAQDANALMEALGIERAVVCGHSMGGAIAQRIAIDFPERVGGLLLYSTSSRVGAAATANWMRQAEESDAAGNPWLAAARRSVAAYNMDEEIKGFRVPTLIIVGDKDPTTPAGGSVIMSRCIEDSELEIYPGIGHSVLTEEPKAVVRVGQWLQQFKTAAVPEQAAARG